MHCRSAWLCRGLALLAVVGICATVQARDVPANVRTTDVVVVPLIYEMYDGASQPSVDAYNLSLPKGATQAALQATLDRVASWYLKTTFGVQKLNMEILPPVTLGKARQLRFGEALFGRDGGGRQRAPRHPHRGDAL